MESITVRVGGVPEHFNTPWYLLHENQPLLNQGIAVNFIPQPGGTGQMANALRNDELDVAVLLTEGITANILKGDDVKLIRFYVNSPLHWGFHVSAQSGFSNMNDLTNKRFAISRPYSGSHLMAHVHANKLGKQLTDEQFVVVKDLDGARKALNNNEADYFLWEKYTTQPLVDSGDFTRIGEVPTPWPCFVIAVRTSFLAKHETAIGQVIESITKYQLELENNEVDTIVAIANRFGLMQDQVSKWFNELTWNKSNELPKVIFENVIQNLLSAGVLEKRHAEKPIDFLYEMHEIHA